MSSDEETYCRLCAEPTPEHQLIKTSDDVAITSKIVTKMSWINVDVSSSNYLPKTICFSCFDLLERTWKFLHCVRTAQRTLHDIFFKKLKLPSGCEVKPVVNLKDAGKLIDKNWEEFEVTKTEVKVETSVTNLDGITTVDPSTLLNYGLSTNVKIEPLNEDSYFKDCDSDCNSSNSDEPLLKILKTKRNKRKNKKRKKIRHFEEVDAADLLPNPDAVAIPLDMSLCSMTWEDYTWICAKCDAQCKSIDSLRIHSLEIHSSCCVFKCSDCDKVITNHKTFISHVRKVHYSPLRYCCEFCNKNFSMSSYIRKHKSIEHADIYLKSCQNCGAKFESPDLLQDHILMYAKGFRRHFNKKREKIEKDLKCDQCNKECKTLSNLRVHKLIHMERSRDFSCHVCGKMFFTKGALGTHMTVHEESKPFQCEFCQMSFRARGNLISHISLHYGSKPFVCEQCGKSFRVKRHLKSHSIVHTDLMPYICEYCNKPFRFKTRLNLHLRQHTGYKPYTCVYCQRDFTNGSNFKKHMKRRHNIDTSTRKKVSTKQNSVADSIDLGNNGHTVAVQ